MKKDIHPKYYTEAKVICACGNTWTTGSTQEVIHTEMCSVCHPFFTGEQRIVDTAGQVDRFQRRKERADKMAQERANRSQAKEQKKAGAIFEFVTEEKKPKPEVAPVEATPVAEAAVVAEAAPVAEPKPKRAPRPRAKAKAEVSGEAEGPVAEAKPEGKKARKAPKPQAETASAAESPAEPAAE